MAESVAGMHAMSGFSWNVAPAVGGGFIMHPLGQIMAKAGTVDEFVTATINPGGFGGEDRYNATGEYSWGVLGLTGDIFSDSAKVSDQERENLNLVS